MRTLLTALTGLFLLAAAPARAGVDITIDKSAQEMTVAVNGAVRYTWPVSSGVPKHETPGGSFRAFRMEEDHYSKEWDDAPMPHSIFFTRTGHAIHGTDHVRNIGVPASHGCVRLSRENAATLYALVEREGVLKTTVTLTGSASTAIAHGLKPRGTQTASRAPAAAYGAPVQLSPPQQPYGGRYAGEDDRQAYPGYPPQGYAQQGYAPGYPRPYADPYYGQRPYAPGYPGYGQGYGGKHDPR